MSKRIEMTKKYVTSVDDLPSAWAFVMAHIDEVGKDPSIEISPVWSGPDFETRSFEVSVSGMVEVSRE